MLFRSGWGHIPTCRFCIVGIIGEFFSAASISIAEIIKEIPVINQLSVSISNQLSDFNLFTRLLPNAVDNARVSTCLVPTFYQR